MYKITLLCLVFYIQDTWIESRMWPPTSWSVTAMQNKNRYKTETADENKSYQPCNMLYIETLHTETLHNIYGTYVEQKRWVISYEYRPRSLPHKSRSLPHRPRLLPHRPRSLRHKPRSLAEVTKKTEITAAQAEITAA